MPLPKNEHFWPAFLVAQFGTPGGPLQLETEKPDKKKTQKTFQKNECK